VGDEGIPLRPFREDDLSMLTGSAREPADWGGVKPGPLAAFWGTLRLTRCLGRYAADFVEADLRREPIDGPAGAALLGAFFDEIVPLYPGWSPGVGPTAEPHEVVPPRGCFLVSYDGGAPIGCVAVKKLDEHTGEIKRLYVVPGARHAGVARRLLGAIEDVARELGCETVRLDTGDKQPASLSLFRATGYVEIEDYNGNPYASYWMEKRL